MQFTVAQQPEHEPYEFRARAWAGQTTVQAQVAREPGQPHVYKLWYSFPRGSVRRPTPISFRLTVIDAEGNRDTEELRGTRGIGHRLFPANYCPD